MKKIGGHLTAEQFAQGHAEVDGVEAKRGGNTNGSSKFSEYNAPALEDRQ
jgi:hypothetical protein